MEIFFSLISVVLAVLLPGFLVTAIRAQDEEKSGIYMILACLAFGVIVFTLIAKL